MCRQAHTQTKGYLIMKYEIRYGSSRANDSRYPLSRADALSMSALGKRKFAALEREAKTIGTIVTPLDNIHTLIIAAE
jgi:predicted alpha/beta-hydrolase family hydrolase